MKCWARGMSSLSGYGIGTLTWSDRPWPLLRAAGERISSRSDRSDHLAHLSARATGGEIGRSALVRLPLAGQCADRPEQFLILPRKNRAQVDLQLASGDIADHRHRVLPQPRGYFLRFECAVRQIERDRSNHRAWQRAT